MFLMSPLQHHFELKGWPEVQIVTRFWIVSGLVHRVRGSCSSTPSGSVGRHRVTPRQMSPRGWRRQTGTPTGRRSVPVVAGLGASGFAAADALLRVGAAVEVVEAAPTATSAVSRRTRDGCCEPSGADVRMGVRPDDYTARGDLLIPSPGSRPRHRWIAAPRPRRSGAASSWPGSCGRRGFPG